jgi:hypothetical protein
MRGAVMAATGAFALCAAVPTVWAASPPKRPPLALVEEVLPPEDAGVALPRPVVGILADALEKATKRPVHYADKDVVETRDADESSVDTGSGPLLELYGTALEEYSKHDLKEAYSLLQDVKLKILGDPARHLRDTRIADALADAMLLMADIDITVGRVDGARGGLHDYIATFPTRDPSGGHYSAGLRRAWSIARSEMVAAGGGRAVLSAEHGPADIYLNGFRVGRTTVDIAWLPEGIYQAFVVESDHWGPSTELDVWSGKSVTLTLKVESARPVNPFFVRLRTRADAERWSAKRSGEVTRLVLMAGAKEAIVLRAYTEAAGVRVICAIFRETGFVDTEGHGLYDIEKVLLSDTGDLKAAAKVLKPLAAALARRLEAGGAVVRSDAPPATAVDAVKAEPGTKSGVSVSASLPAASPDLPERIVDPPPRAAAVKSGSLLGRWWFWTAVGAVVVVGVAVAVGVVAAQGSGCPRDAGWGCLEPF